MMKPLILALDLEGVLVPEIWVAVARQTGIEALGLTTRDEPDYDALMRKRLDALDRHGVRLSDIRAIIAELEPLPGASRFLAAMREQAQAVLLSDTFYEFAGPLMRKLDWPTLFCNSLETDADGRIVGYRLRKPDGKRAAVQAFQELRFAVVAVGDSYNDTGMLAQADVGLLFQPSENVRRDFPRFPVTQTYGDIEQAVARALTE